MLWQLFIKKLHSQHGGGFNQAIKNQTLAANISVSLFSLLLAIFSSGIYCKLTVL
jgi:hypothetical protein